MIEGGLLDVLSTSLSCANRSKKELRGLVGRVSIRRISGIFMINSRRREERVPARLPVRVWGMDAYGKPFTHSTSTVDVTRTGARIGAIPCEIQQGDIIGIQHGNEKARFRVAWVGKPGTGRQGQIGVVCAEPGKYIWGTPLESLKALARAEMGRSVPGSSFVQPLNPVQAAPTTTSSAAKGSERRDAARFACTGGAEFRNVNGGFKNWGTVSDVSDTGCYVETIFPLPAESQIELLVSIRNVDIRGRALVRSSHPNVGMGIEFLELSPEDRERLERLLAMLAIAPGNTQRTGAVPAMSTPPVAPVPSPAYAPVNRLGPRQDPPVADQLYRLCTELRDAETLLEANSERIEPRALAEFLRALNHTRESALALQHSMEQTDGPDRFKFLAERDSARVRTVAALARELAVDVDGSALQPGSEGFDGLLSAVSALHKRLAALVDNDRAEEGDIPAS